MKTHTIYVEFKTPDDSTLVEGDFLNAVHRLLFDNSEPLMRAIHGPSRVHEKKIKWRAYRISSRRKS